MSNRDFSKPAAVAAAKALVSDPQASVTPAPPTSSPDEAAVGWVQPCHSCDGRGAVMRAPHLALGDPDNWPIGCKDCGGSGYHPCPGCGNTEYVEGYDCIVCENDGARPAESYVPAGAA